MQEGLQLQEVYEDGRQLTGGGPVTPVESGPREVQSARCFVLDGAVVAAVLLNSVAVAYGFYQLREISDAFRWAVAPGLAVLAATREERSGPGTHFVVEVFHNLSCPACRSSAAAIDSVRRDLGQEVHWRFHFVTRGPRLDPLGYRAALLAACMDEESAYEFFLSLSRAGEWSLRDLEGAATASGPDPGMLEACVRSSEAQRRVWQDAFDAHAAGVAATPTVRIRGIGLRGPVSAEPLREFIASFSRGGT